MMSPATDSSKDFGIEILKALKHLIIQLPSAVLPAEYNFIINPLHKDFSKVKLLSVDDFFYDIRVKTS